MKNFLTTTALGAICVLGSIQVTTASPVTTEPTTPTENYTLQVRGGGHGGGHSFGGSRGDFGGDHGAAGNFGGDRGEVARHDDRNFRRDDGYGYGDYGYGDSFGADVGYDNYVGAGGGGDVGGCVTLADGSVYCN